MRTIEIIEKELLEAKEELKPIEQMRDKVLEKVNALSLEAEKFKIDNGLFRPMSDLKEYAGKEISCISLVVKKDDGTLAKKEMYNCEMFEVDEDGHLDFSSFECGVMHYDKKLQKYVYYYHFKKTEYDFVGFLEIELED